MKNLIKLYKSQVNEALDKLDPIRVEKLAKSLSAAWKHGKYVYLCGNGGSAGNAIHMANDFIYGAGVNNKNGGLKVEALSSNQAVITCLANDLGYDFIYSEQIKVKGKEGDILIALSGSGNSKNIVNAINEANQIGMNTFAILGYSGGEAKKIVQNPIHFEINDMQIAEDLQLIVGHICMQWLASLTEI